MPAIDPSQLVSSVIDAVEQSGGVASYVSTSTRSHPRKFLLNYNGQTFSLWVYMWTLTHGGRVTLPDEYRIQMTSVASPLPLNPSGLTVLLGYYQDLGLFAGFDLQKHRTFTAGSPSVQIDLSAINEALQHGLSFKRKDNDEIAIGLRPDQFITYVLNAEELHRLGAEADLTDLLVKAAEQKEIAENEITALTADRRQIVENVSRLSRDAAFRRIVMSAYDNRCAITRAQLRLIDAAHILPVASDESSDHVTNGISLSPTYHRAYDSRLIYLDEDFVLRLNDEKVDELRANNLIGGFADFCRSVGQRIHLPADRAQYPNPEFIKLANRYRRIPGYI